MFIYNIIIDDDDDGSGDGCWPCCVLMPVDCNDFDLGNEDESKIETTKKKQQDNQN